MPILKEEFVKGRTLSCKDAVREVLEVGKANGFTADELAEHTGFHYMSVRKAVGTLEENGLVESRVIGRNRYYSFVSEKEEKEVNE